MGTRQSTWSDTDNTNRAVGQTVNLADSTANEWYITGVQLEVGTSATPFEFLPYDVNLQRCQRYYQTFRAGNTIYVTGNQTWRWIDQFFCTMRTIPSVTVTDVIGTTTINQITDTSVERQVATGTSGSKAYRADLAMDSEL